MLKGKSLWDRMWAPQLEEKLPSLTTLYEETALLIQENIESSNEALILEPGCGSGRLSLLLALKGARVVLLDTSIEALKLAQRLCMNAGVSKNASFVVGDIRCLPFRNSIFSAVFNEGVVEHFIGEYRQLVINEMVSKAKKGGKVAIIVPNANNPPYLLYKKLYEVMYSAWPWGLEVPYTSVELKQRLQKAGITDLKSGGCRLISVTSYLQNSPLKIVLLLLLPIQRVMGPKWLRINAGYDILHRNFARYIFCVGIKT